MMTSVEMSCQPSSTSEETEVHQENHVDSTADSSLCRENQPLDFMYSENSEKLSSSGWNAGNGGRSDSSEKLQNENACLVASSESDRTDAALSVQYSSPVSQCLPEVPSKSYSKDIKDPGAVQGSCGLYNLGNTCFMNSGLQCLMSSTAIVKYFMDNFLLDDGNKHTLLGQFYRLLCKMWCGQFSVVYPKDFKETLGLYHSQFQDYRQHDCQEFLVLLLDTFHEQLNSTRFKSLALSNNEASGSSSVTQLEPLPNLLNNQESSPSSDFVSPSSPEPQSDHVTSSVSQSADPNLEHRVVSECTSSTGVGYSSVLNSEDSNQSTVSVHSTDSEQSLNIKKLHLQSGDSVCSEDTSMVKVSSSTDTLNGKNNHRINVANPKRNSNTSVLNQTAHTSQVSAKTDNNIVSSKSDNLVHLNNISSSKLPPSLLDYYGKETKTLNTNVLMSETPDGDVAVDSDKFAKLDNRYRPQMEEVNILQEVLGDEAKADKDIGPHTFGIKDTNLRVDKKSRFMSKSCPNVLDTHTDLELNNIKRIKMDPSEPTKSVSVVESEKNVQIQEMSKFNTQKVLEEEMSEGESSAESMDAEEAESSDEEGEVTSRSSSVNALPLAASFVNNRAEIYQEEADSAWNKYLEENNSVVVSTFQGQFQSTVVCSSCCHVSVTYEPFMYLSLPIPRAMERQICVIFIPHGMTPMRFLLNMHKNDKVSELKKELLKSIQRPDCDITVAEVFSCHISRILDDNIMLRYVNDTTRVIYAFEMVQPVIPEEETPDGEANMPQPLSEMPAPKDPTPSGDIFSNMGTFNKPDNSFLNVSHRQLDPLMTGSMADVFSESKDMSWVGTNTELESRHMTSPEPMAEHTDVGKDMVGTGLWEWNQGSFVNRENPWDNQASSSEFNPPPLPRDVVDSVQGITNQWRTCAICLEELADNDLLTHHSCSGTFCQNCLEMSAKHSGESGYCCPICLMPADMTEDFSPLVNANSQKPKLRVIATPVAFRCNDTSGDNLSTERLFAHPTVIYVPNRISGESLYDMIDKILPFPAVYCILLTDGQGLRCSRCMYTAHCTGCVVCREGEITLQPGDNLTIHITEVTPNSELQAATCEDHHSMEDLRPNEPITLYDCFEAFTESEILDEHNPWYCPHCQQNQCAKKTMTVWRYPDTLILHLKRFVFHELSSTKVDNKVVFPHQDLDLSRFLSGPKVKDLNYDLYSVVCHFGGSHSGHYTSYTRHPVLLEWFYNNDETVSRQAPHDNDFSSGYVLFYQRKGTSENFKPVTNLTMLAEGETSMTSSPPHQAIFIGPSLPPGGLPKTSENLSDDDVGCSAESPMSVVQTPTEQAEADSNFDFYS